MNEVELLMLDGEITDLYRQYLSIEVPDGFETKDLREWIEAISNGEKGGLTLKQCVLGCINTAIWSRSTSYDEILRMAKDKQVDPEKAAIHAKFEEQISRLESDDTAEQENISGTDFSLELSTHDLFEIRKMELEINSLTHLELKDLFINMFRQYLIREKAYVSMLKRGWNVGEYPGLQS